MLEGTGLGRRNLRWETGSVLRASLLFSLVVG